MNVPSDKSSRKLSIPRLNGLQDSQNSRSIQLSSVNSGIKSLSLVPPSSTKFPQSLQKNTRSQLKMTRLPTSEILNGSYKMDRPKMARTKSECLDKSMDIIEMDSIKNSVSLTELVPVKCQSPDSPDRIIGKRSLTNYEAHNTDTKNCDYGLKMFLTLITEAIRKTGKIPKIVVIDFDQTITIGHTRGMQHLPINLTERMKVCLDNIQSPEVLKQFLHYMKSNSIDVWIASYATSTNVEVSKGLYSGKRLIREYLRALYHNEKNMMCPIPSDHILAFQTGTFTEGYILACEELGVSPMSNPHKEKNNHLMIIAKRTNTPEKNYKTICLIDDDNNNINAANEVFFGININDVRKYK
ncbi:MAG: hypothetical protein Terrestrivirus6_24 [Terrestrivirus sp.]|uniref:FCP1 homology domain-containing protein n=1 Tax=Terrestrivirus sp. TaxID=2487775 RepID=A0A3G4ZNG2_9VIRU|nr:MAG: hypothetical protein Terrestrivirus6_24 [Terrestrivirus sp.]